MRAFTRRRERGGYASTEARCRVRSVSASTSAAKRSASALSHSHVSMMITAARVPHVWLYEPKSET